MTKLLQWLFTLAFLGSTWATITLNCFGLDLLPPLLYQVPLPHSRTTVPLSTYFLMTFGCYSLGIVEYCLVTLNDCEDAAQELQARIREAWDDLTRHGMKF